MEARELSIKNLGQELEKSTLESKSAQEALNSRISNLESQAVEKQAELQEARKATEEEGKKSKQKVEEMQLQHQKEISQLQEVSTKLS